MSKVMVSLPEDLLKAVDSVAHEEERSRSSLLAEAARLYLRLRLKRMPRRERPEVKAAVAAIERLARADRAADWDGTEVIRSFRDQTR